MAKTRTAEQIQRDFDEKVPELARAINALIRGYLPPEMRSVDFSVELTTDPKPALVKKRAPRGPAAR